MYEFTSRTLPSYVPTPDFDTEFQYHEALQNRNHALSQGYPQTVWALLSVIIDENWI